MKTQNCFGWMVTYSVLGTLVLICGCSGWSTFCPGFLETRSLAIPDTYPLGSVNRAHYHTMETNAEAYDFIIHWNEFVDSSAELTPYGKDHIVEIAARMRSAPFPVVVERGENNSDPELDQHRRNLVAQVLTGLGASDAVQRTVVSTAYGKGITGWEGEADYYQFIFSRGGYGSFGNTGANTFGAGSGGAGFGGGFGGAGSIGGVR